MDSKFYPKGRCYPSGDPQLNPPPMAASHPYLSPAAAAANPAQPTSSSFTTMQTLPEFPTLRELDHAASSIPADKLQTLVMMYRAHCQRIMDSINKFSFTEVMRGCSVGYG